MGGRAGGWGGRKNSRIAAGECIIAVTQFYLIHTRDAVYYMFCIHTYGILGQVLF